MDQNNTRRDSSQLTFIDIVRMFRGKLKFFVTIALVAIVIGGVIGGAVSLLFASYGGTVNFYLTAKDGSNALIPLLQSESFAEKLLLDENGLPPKEECNEEDYNAALAAVIAYEEIRQQRKDIIKKIDLYDAELAIIENEHTRLVSDYNKRFSELSIYLSAQDEIAKGEGHAAAIAEHEVLLAEASSKLETYTNETYNPAKAVKYAYDEEYVRINSELFDARIAKDEALDKVLKPWRAREENRELISLISESVTYEYAKIVDANDSNTDLTTEKNQNSAFLVVTVNVQFDKETATFIIERIKDRMPNYVEDNIERLTGTRQPICTLISTFTQTKVMSERGPIVMAALGAVICAIVVVVVAYLAVIIKGLLPNDILEKKNKKTEKTKKNIDNEEA